MKILHLSSNYYNSSKEFDESEKLVAKTSCDLENDIIVDSKDIFAKDEHCI